MPIKSQQWLQYANRNYAADRTSTLILLHRPSTELIVFRSVGEIGLSLSRNILMKRGYSSKGIVEFKSPDGNCCITEEKKKSRAWCIFQHTNLKKDNLVYFLSGWPQFRPLTIMLHFGVWCHNEKIVFVKWFLLFIDLHEWCFPSWKTISGIN